MTEDFNKAIEIADKLESVIQEIHPRLSYRNIAKLAELTAMAIREQIPMYTAVINPKWKIYDDVVAITKGRRNGRT